MTIELYERFLGFLERSTSIEDIVSNLKSNGINTIYLFPHICYFSGEPFGSEPTVKAEINIKNPKGKTIAFCRPYSEWFCIHKGRKDEDRERLFRMIMTGRKAVYEDGISLREAFEFHEMEVRFMYPTNILTTYFYLPQDVSFIELTEEKEKKLKELFSEDLEVDEFIKKQNEILNP